MKMPRYSRFIPAPMKPTLLKLSNLFTFEMLLIFLLTIFGFLAYYRVSIPQTSPNLAAFVSLCIIVGAGSIGNIYATRFGQDPMLGMLFSGILVKFMLPNLVVAIPHKWTAVLWTQALASVIARAGLSLQKPKVLPHLLRATMIGTVPILMETVFLGTVSKDLLLLPTNWAFTLAFGVACISPGVVVPILLNLLDNGWKSSKLPPMLLTAVGIDVLWGTAGFGIFLASCFKHKHEVDGDHTWVGRGIEEIAFGVILGSIAGLAAYLVSKFNIPEQQRTYIIFTLSAFTMIWCKSVGYAGAASCSTFITWSTIANTWPEQDIQKADLKLKHLWTMFKPFLFPVIGATITFSDTSPIVLVECIVLVMAGVVIKMVGAYLTAIVAGCDNTESVFICGVWSGKASIQVISEIYIGHTVRSCN